MVVRFTVIAGILLGTVSWVLLVPLAPRDFQASPGSSIGEARDAGLVPMPGNFKMSDDIGHEVFEVPDADAEHLAMVTASGGGTAAKDGMQMGEPEGEHAEEPMPGMQMGTAEGEADGQPMPGMQMGEIEAEQAEESMPGMQMGTAEGEAAEQPMPGMAMGGEGDHAAEAEEGDGGGGGLTVMAAHMAGMAGRTVEIEMTEWAFSNKAVTVKPGEVVRFVVRNTGNTPHEFMFMPGAAMQAVSYRLERADWNLLEHEAPFEQSIVMPGDSFEVVLRIDRPGTWMFMCMFPYHMQFGMMGMMMSEGASMEGMKM